MLTRVLHPVTRAELYSFSSALPTCRRLTPTTVGLYGPDGAFKRMMDTIRKDQRLRDAGGYVLATQAVKQTALGPVVHVTYSKFDL